MYPEFLAVGFDQQPGEISDLVFDQELMGEEDCGDGYQLCAVYVDPSGARISVGLRDSKPYLHAGVSGPVSEAAEVTRLSDTTARVDMGDAMVLANVEFPAKYASDEPHHAQELRLSAVGVEDLRVYPTEEAYLAEDDSAAVGQLISPGLISLQGGVQQPNAVAFLSGRCRQVELRANALTGKSFWYLLIDTKVPIAVALPEGVKPAPAVGSVVAGTVLLYASEMSSPA
ncbi:hypothetical protein CATRI_02125 [Corynebacterium atrinae]|uniref:hypothetical protein n=1 Tax=Corynebacterium atrinae TaxID=1336740 RepID=UPI0025B4609D|nr:hypothetical protein [Corynebacterium atrinae]WJY62530.1 hypothetical protein CATRI_02125 [Corynebacterium atrinae]